MRAASMSSAGALLTVATTVAVVAGCGPTGTDDEATGTVADAVFVPGVVEPAVPIGGLSDFVTYADQLAVFTVMSERLGESEDEGPDAGRPRFVTIRIDDNLWVGPRDGHQVVTGSGTAPAVVPEGEQIELTTWGTVGTTEDGRPRMLSAFGEPPLEVGETYVAGLFMMPDGLGTYPGTVSRTDGATMQVPGPEGPLIELTDGELDLHTLTAAVSSATPDPRIADTGLPLDEFFALDAVARSLAIARTTEPVSPSTT